MSPQCRQRIASAYKAFRKRNKYLVSALFNSTQSTPNKVNYFQTSNKQIINLTTTNGSYRDDPKMILQNGRSLSEATVMISIKLLLTKSILADVQVIREV